MGSHGGRVEAARGGGQGRMNVVLIYTVTVVLIGMFIGICSLLVRPRSLRAGLVLGALLAWHWESRLDLARSFTCRFRFRWLGAG
jgi:hypothetical protein